MEVAIELIVCQTLLYSSGLGASDLLEIVSQDTVSAFPCNWSIITFECTANRGKGAIVWTGTAFSGCDVNEIILLHSRFDASTSSYHQCNKDMYITLNGLKNIRVENNSYYISQLEVIVKPAPGINDEMIMKTIECIHDNGTHTMLVGSMTINVSNTCSNTTSTLKEEKQDSNTLAIMITSVALVLLFIFLLSIVSLLLYGFRKKFRSTPALVHDTSGRVTREKSKCQVVSYDEVGNHVEIVKSFDNETMGIYSLSDLTPDDSFAVQNDDNNIIAKGETLSCDLTYNLVHALGGQVSSKWYSLGLAIGVPKQVLNQLKHNSDEECLVEVLDYWLRHHPGKPMWEEVMEARNRIIVSNTA